MNGRQPLTRQQYQRERKHNLHLKHRHRFFKGFHRSPSSKLDLNYRIERLKKRLDKIILILVIMIVVVYLILIFVNF